MKKNIYALILGILLISVLLSGCSAPTSTQSSNTSTSTQTTSNTVTINLTAKNMAFDKSTITVPAGTHVKVIFDNQDNGVPHNFAVYETSEAKKSIFVGKIITGMATTTYEFDAPTKVGTYFFRCDVHNTMNGQFIVQTGGTASTGGTGSVGY